MLTSDSAHTPAIASVRSLGRSIPFAPTATASNHAGRQMIRKRWKNTGRTTETSNVKITGVNRALATSAYGQMLRFGLRPAAQA